MTFDEYQKLAKKTETFSTENTDITSMAFINKLLGLSGETGEVVDKFKKIYRNDSGKMSDEQKQEIVKELGDVLWYLSMISEYLGVNFDDVAKGNLKKLADRQSRGVLKSRGDNR